MFASSESCEFVQQTFIERLIGAMPGAWNKMESSFQSRKQSMEASLPKSEEKPQGMQNGPKASTFCLLKMFILK